MGQEGTFVNLVSVCWSYDRLRCLLSGGPQKRPIVTVITNTMLGTRYERLSLRAQMRGPTATPSDSEARSSPMKISTLKKTFTFQFEPGMWVSATIPSLDLSNLMPRHFAKYKAVVVVLVVGALVCLVADSYFGPPWGSNVPAG
jgi:hypothetical protein